MPATRPSLAPEAELVLLTAAASPHDAALRRLVEAERFDWKTFNALAQYANAAPVIWRRLRGLGMVASDADTRTLRQLAMVSVMRMLQLEQLLHQTLAALSGQRVEVMLLKGAALAYTAYESFADRPMSDLDLLIRPAETAESAWSYLQTPAGGWTWPSERWAKAQYTSLHHLPPLIQQPAAGGEGEEFRLEIHRGLLPEGHPFQLPVEALWGRARRISRNGHELIVPDPLHQLWHLCVHFAWSHEIRWGAWRTLRDVGMIITGGSFEWDGFVELAHSSRASTCCYWTLRFSRRLTGTPVPETVLAALRPPRPEPLLDRLERHYVSNFFPSKDECPSVLLSNLLWEAGIAPRWSRHGPARPWKVTEQWAAGAELPPAPRHSIWRRLAKVGDWWRYLRYIQRLTLPEPS